VSVKRLQDGKPGCGWENPYLNRTPTWIAGSTLADVTDLPAIPPGGPQNY